MSDLTELQQDERRALLLERPAVLRVVSALRQYRAAVAKAREMRWGDGALDGCHAGSLFMAIDEIENPPTFDDHEETPR